MSNAARNIADEYYEEAEVLSLLAITKKTLSWRRSMAPQNVPPYIKLGVRCIYPKAEFHKWLESQVVRFTPKALKSNVR